MYVVRIFKREARDSKVIRVVTAQICCSDKERRTSMDIGGSFDFLLCRVRFMQLPAVRYVS